jgi:hypothetical protein
MVCMATTTVFDLFIISYDQAGASFVSCPPPPPPPLTPDFSSRGHTKMTQVQLPVILRIFYENQNPVDMHTSIMCINILQNIKAVAPKVCMSTGFWWSGGDIICVLQTHFIFKKITPNKTTLSIIIKCRGILLF